MKIYLTGNGEALLLTEEHTYRLNSGVIEQRRTLPIMLRKLLRMPGEDGKYLDIVGGFVHCGVHSPDCYVDFERAVGWGIIVSGRLRFKGIIFPTWAEAPISAKACMDTVRFKMGIV